MLYGTPEFHVTRNLNHVSQFRVMRNAECIVPILLPFYFGWRKCFACASFAIHVMYS